MLLPVILFAAGLFLVVKGGDIFVDAARWMAEVSGIPKFVVGATVVSLATTLPELLVSLFSSLDGSVDMAVGNAVGSVTVNAGLIMGISILCCPSTLDRGAFALKALLMLVSAVTLTAFGCSGQLGAAACALLALLFAAFAAESVWSGRSGAREQRPPRPGRRAICLNLGKFIFGAAGIVVGAELMVDAGLVIARALGVPEAVIGVTLMGVGTSLPELVTTVAALKRGEAAMSIGNIVGANVIDLTLILPVCALFAGRPLAISAQARALDLPALAVVIAAAALPAILGKKTRRAQGALLLLLYAAYLALLFTRGG